jgi:hypothetical protein
VDYHRGADCGGDLLVQEVVFASRDEDTRDRIAIPFNFGRADVGCAENDPRSEWCAAASSLTRFSDPLPGFTFTVRFLPLPALSQWSSTVGKPFRHGGDRVKTAEDFTKGGISGAVYKNRTKQKL